MNKRVTIEMPDDMHRLILKYAEEAGKAPDAYMLDILEERLEDAYFVKRAEEALDAIERGESRIVSGEEFWRGLDD
ncbi:DUF6290 family protein [Rhizobium halophytocola]|uniref:RHH-type rel operon transcriptional repressor/antitoxin RelB n=1 Tax=Rhizobium halophytocola TaxID=735519 RepID=A0ABS4DXX4_9HYPH|nr:DUF6290 family protein [Rhizobium halophytocola]MBP1850474.1 RHH-type rel operon transcriptional repressor/antitoxin RelB [Rhizobium halophytocola]